MSSDWAVSALRWWEEAGVDTIVGETARDWLNPAAKAPAPPAPAEAAAAVHLPDDLKAFQQWLLATDQLPNAVAASPRLAPTGDPSSDLMMLIDMPAVEDVAAGALLAGEVGEMFDRMLGRMERSRDSIYLASLSPARAATGRLTPNDAAKLAEIARHHIALVAPKALLLFGDLCSQALLGTSVAGARERWHEVDTPRGKVRTIATFHPHYLHRQPNSRKMAWEDLQMLMEGLKP